MALFLDLLDVIGLTKNDKELEILILRQQIRILQLKSLTPGFCRHLSRFQLRDSGGKVMQPGRSLRNADKAL